ncbi:MAG: M4 family metallopeptidase [Myxococcota bacterium]
MRGGLLWGAAGLTLGLASTAAASPGGAVKRLRTGTPDVAVDFDVARGVARFVRSGTGVRGLGSAPVADQAHAFIADYGDLFGLADATAELQPTRTFTDRLGFTHVEYAQSFEGLPVFGTTVRAHFDPAGALVAAQGATVPTPPLSPTPSLSEAEAIAVAKDAVSDAANALSVELVVFDLGLITKRPAEARLAYAVTLRGPDEHQTLFVDAHDGEALFAVSHIHEVLNRATYEFGYGPEFLVWQESDGPYAGGDPAMQALIDFSEDTYDLFLNISGGEYASYDGESGVMEGVLNAPLQCPNAQWNGVSTNYCDGLVTDDVVAHEWAHGFTQFTQGLIYAYQPGALNESYSDIFGEAVDLLNGAGTDTPGQTRPVDTCSGDGDSVRWLIGEDTQGFGGAIRDMWTPSCNAHPDRVGGVEYFCNFDGDFFDNGGVHINSGIPNHAFALLVDGGTYNGQSVPAIGMTKALSIYWRAMSVYQGEVSGFADHAAALQASCSDLRVAGLVLPDPLSGNPSGETVTGEDCTAVDAAVAATEMAAANPCGEGPLFDPSSAPPLCGDGSDGIVFFEERFEAGFDAWGRTNEPGSPDYQPRDWALVFELPDNRPGAGVYAIGDQSIGDCFTDNQSGVMHLDSPSFEVPNEPGAAVMTFRHWLASEPRLDGGNVSVRAGNGNFVRLPATAFSFNGYNGSLDFSDNPLSGEGAFSGSDVASPTGTWVESVVNLDEFTDPGDTIALRFDFGVNECDGLFGWYLDDIRVTWCSVVTGDDGDADDGSLDTTGADDGAGTGVFTSAGGEAEGTSAGSSDGTGVGQADGVVGRGCACTTRRNPVGVGTAGLVLLGLLGLRRRL